MLMTFNFFYLDTLHVRGPPRSFGEQGNKGIYFWGIGEQSPKFEGNRGTKTILRNREHKKTNFRSFWEQGNKPIYFRGTREHVPPGSASCLMWVHRAVKFTGYKKKFAFSMVKCD